MKRYWIFLAFSVLSFSSALAQMPIEDELYAYVLGIEGRTPIGRSEFIEDQLHKMGVGYVTSPFKKTTVKGLDTLEIKGKNIIGRLGKGKYRIVVGAHYDAITDSPGANDNGSGVAVMLALIQHLQDVEWNYTVDFCFFDQKEAGLVGSFYYVTQFVIPQRHFAMINLDMEGSGEEVFIGPVGDNNRIIIRYVHEAAQKTGFPFTERAEFPRSDHESFANLHLENISVSVIPKGNADWIIKFARNGYKADSTDTSQLLGVLHTVDDRSNIVSPVSLKTSYEFTKTLLLMLNEVQYSPPVKEPPKETGKKKLK